METKYRNKIVHEISAFPRKVGEALSKVQDIRQWFESLGSLMTEAMHCGNYEFWIKVVALGENKYSVSAGTESDDFWEAKITVNADWDGTKIKYEALSDTDIFSTTDELSRRLTNDITIAIKQAYWKLSNN